MSTTWLSRIFNNKPTSAPEKAYDLWANKYDDQPGNLMLDLDEAVFTDLFREIDLEGKTVLDIGCGTGRHWKKMSDQKPVRMIGIDISRKMLAKLKQKFPSAETWLSNNVYLPQLEDKSCDFILSTLTIAHIEKIEKAFIEWNRVLKPGGEMVLTDYHPEAIAKGAKRTFLHKGKTIAIKNFIHSTNKMRLLAEQLGYREIRFIEKYIDDSVKNYYEEQNALDLFERFRGTPIFYGIHLKKSDGPA